MVCALNIRPSSRDMDTGQYVRSEKEEKKDRTSRLQPFPTCSTNTAHLVCILRTGLSLRRRGCDPRTWTRGRQRFSPISAVTSRFGYVLQARLFDTTYMSMRKVLCMASACAVDLVCAKSQVIIP